MQNDENGWAPHCDIILHCASIRLGVIILCLRFVCVCVVWLLLLSFFALHGIFSHLEEIEQWEISIVSETEKTLNDSWPTMQAILTLLYVNITCS